MQPEPPPSPATDLKRKLSYELVVYALFFAAITGLGIAIVAAAAGGLACWL